MMFSGTSTCTTPGRPLKLTRSARRRISGMRSALGTWHDHFVIGAVTAVWSKFW
jgi:hypothetical protein